MFSQASVHQSFCLGRIGTSYAPWDMSHGVVTLPWASELTWVPTLPALDIRPGHLHPLLLTSGSNHWRLFKIVHLRTYPSPQQYRHLVVATQNTYSWQVGSMHPTGMQSCLNIVLLFCVRF